MLIIKNTHTEPLIVSIDLEDENSRMEDGLIYPNEVFEIDVNIPSHLKVKTFSFLKDNKPYKLLINLVDKDL